MELKDTAGRVRDVPCRHGPQRNRWARWFEQHVHETTRNTESANMKMTTPWKWEIQKYAKTTTFMNITPVGEGLRTF